VLTRRDYPSHGRILDLGSTTITEAWNAHLGIDFASHNHFNLGSVCTWFVNHLGGITGATPGMRSLRLAPAFPHGLDRVEARLLIPAGWVRSAWRRSGDGIDLDLELPVPAALHLPPGWRLRSPSGDTLAPGRHRLGLESGATPTA
jgi:alpha-L-rhamnosidase